VAKYWLSGENLITFALLSLPFNVRTSAPSSASQSFVLSSSSRPLATKAPFGE
jgi:hypothetical protein